MKLNYSFILLVFINYTIFAQPTFNSSSFNSTYTLESYSAFEVPNLTFGGTGANQTWNYSGLTLDSSTNFSSVSVSSTPYSSSFPTANFAFVNSGYYTYFKSTSTTFELIGGADEIDTYPLSNSIILFTLPYTYNSVFTDTSQNLGEEEIITTVSTYDGYGTLITPFATYSNVIRQKRVQTSNLYNYISTDYLWYSTNPFKILMIINFFEEDNIIDNYVEVYKESNLNLNEIVNNNLVKIFPNPTTNFLNLEMEEVLQSVKIVDIYGRVTLTPNFSNKIIDVNNLLDGVYFIEITTDKNVYKEKFIKK